MYKHNQV